MWRLRTWRKVYAKYLTVTTVSLADLRSRLYEAYATQHAGCGGDEAAALAYRRDIRPLLPPPTAGPVIDLGGGRGDLVRLLQVDGFDAEGIDISPEQAALARAAGVAQVRQGDFRTILARVQLITRQSRPPTCFSRPNEDLPSRSRTMASAW